MVAAEQDEYRRAIGDAACIDFVSSLDTTLLWDKPALLWGSYDAVMLGGSGEFDFDGGRAIDDDARITSQEIVVRLRPFIEWVVASDVPLLGICYGHQIVSETLGVPVVNDHAQKKVGSYEVILTEEGKQDKVFGQLPERFLVQYGHKDSLSLLPTGAVLLAQSRVCRTSALRFGKNVYTMQFHPELTREDIYIKLANSPGYLPEGVDLETLLQPSLEASRIIPLFVSSVVS